MGKSSEFYGVLEQPNIRRICFGKYEIDSWYGNAAYFGGDHKTLGYKKITASEKNSQLITAMRKPSLNGHSTTTQTESTTDTESSSQSLQYWLDKLYVCEYCFKYTDVEQECQAHRISCTFKKTYPPVGKLMYRDEYSQYIITKVRGFENVLFTQNLCLFGKLFLDNKSVYYNVDPFDFYIVYGHDSTDDKSSNLKFKPMGFFSKEVLSWDSDNNLACICVFPPFQRKGLGNLLIEFLYELAAVTTGQKFSGPEFPLSPFGKISYYNYWSKKLTLTLYEHIIKEGRVSFNLTEIANLTGFRREDILITLEYMKVLHRSIRKRATSKGSTTKSDDENVYFSKANFQKWCSDNNIDVKQEKSMLNPDYLVL